MMPNVTEQVARFDEYKIFGINTVMDENHTALRRIFEEQQLHYLQILPELSFDDALWNRCYQLDICSYHRGLLDRQLRGRGIYVQREREDKAALLWSRGNAIYRVPLEKKEEFFTLHTYQVGDEESICHRQRMTPLMVRNKILDGLGFNSHKRLYTVLTEQQQSVLRELECLPIQVRLTREAAEEILNLPKEHGSWNVDICIAIDVDPDEKTPLVTITKHFLADRILKVHQSLNAPETVEESVAPAVRSWDAYHQLAKLRTPGSPQKQIWSRIDQERLVSERALNELSPSSLMATLKIRKGDAEESMEFEQDLFPASQKGLQLTIDYRNNHWKLTKR